MTETDRIRWALKHSGSPHQWSHAVRGTPMSVLKETAKKYLENMYLVDTLLGIDDADLDIGTDLDVTMEELFDSN